MIRREHPAALQPPGNAQVPVRTIANSSLSESTDRVSIEEPLEIRLGYLDAGTRLDTTISVTMRTPGDDFDLAVGFLHGEGVIKVPEDCEGVHHCSSPSPDRRLHNSVKVVLASRCEFDPRVLQRHFYTTSSCGVCGKTSLEAVRVKVNGGDSPASDFASSAGALVRLPKSLRAHQKEFLRTGGLHASATFDAEGRIRRVREDVGRHNALDKLIGSYIRNDRLDELRGLGLLLSGRASFELVQKATMARMPLVASIGPPSSLAVELAEEIGITLVGFLKASQFNIYCGHRVTLD